MSRVANKKTPSTQKYLEIAEIRDDAVVLKNGNLRAVIMVSSINFALKSEEEQNAIIAGYISFLNSINSPLQIIVHSRQLDLDAYIEELKKVEKAQTNDLLRLQTAEYRSFISELVELGDIMTKKFYIVVPYDPYTSKRRSFWSRTGEVLSPVSYMSLNQKTFEKRKRDLFVTVERVLSGISSMGLRGTILDTQSLIELYYNTYNPLVSKREKMVNVNQLKLDE